MIHITKSRMNRKALEQTKEFKRLSPRQRMFVLTIVQQVIQGADLDSAAILLATMSAAYEPTTAESRRVFGYQLLGEKKIQAALRIYSRFGKSARQVAMDELKSAMDAAPEGSKKREKLVQLYGQAAFGISVPKSRKSSKKSKRKHHAQK